MTGKKNKKETHSWKKFHVLGPWTINRQKRNTAAGSFRTERNRKKTVKTEKGVVGGGKDGEFGIPLKKGHQRGGCVWVVWGVEQHIPNSGKSL